MTTKYYDTIQMIERLHRYFLDLLKVELDRRGIQDINNVQSMILHNIGDDEMTVGELTVRGYYLGSNVSYNVKKMVENDYLVQERSVHDKRSVRVKLSEKGRELNAQISEMFEKHEEALKNTDLADEDFAQTLDVMKKLERFWAGMSSFAGMSNL